MILLVINASLDLRRSDRFQKQVCQRFHDTLRSNALQGPPRRWVELQLEL
ncbi:hypothetical protein [Sphingobium sp. SA916]|nr:hypothetical protein [Sphingobium sp. SA916]